MIGLWLRSRGVQFGLFYEFCGIIKINGYDGIFCFIKGFFYYFNKVKNWIKIDLIKLLINGMFL